MLHATAPLTNGTTRPGAATGAVRACTLTLVGLVAWVITPPATVLLFATAGLVGVLRTHRVDQAVGHCSLGRPRLIVAYLSAAWLLGAWFTLVQIRAVMS